jgi:hypothetical protein
MLALALGALANAACGDGSSNGDDDAGLDVPADIPADVEPDAAPDGADSGPDAALDAPTDAPRDTVDDGGRPDTPLPCPDPETGFDPTSPGVNISYTLGSVYMMGSPIGMSAGTVFPTAREDFDVEDEEELPLDTCALNEATVSVPSCASNEDCAPEQQCLPRTDDGGRPIAGSERCVTPRDPIDVGPFTVTGFASGPIAMAYNPGQQGAYTPPGSDGTITASEIAGDTTYRIEGEGSAERGLGPFEGELYVPTMFEVTSPVPVIGGLGVPEIQVNPANDLALSWTGSGDPSSVLAISLSGPNGGLSCRVRNDGAFTIPADLITAVNLGNIAFFNVLNLEQKYFGWICGEGLTVSEAMFTQTLLLNVRKVVE